MVIVGTSTSSRKICCASRLELEPNEKQLQPSLPMAEHHTTPPADRHQPVPLQSYYPLGGTFDRWLVGAGDPGETLIIELRIRFRVD